VNFDDLTKEEIAVLLLLKGKNRMEIDEILGNSEKRQNDMSILCMI
jgi:DNA-binding CsgD family transcriptional regulator